MSVAIGWALRSVAGGILMLACSTVPAEARRASLAGPIEAQLVRVVDGDTLIVRARVWIGQTVETMVRIDGIDAPELRGRCAGEREAARAARARVQELIGARPVRLRAVRYGKYAGRVLARVETAEGVEVGTRLVEEGHARRYAGGRREPWCGHSAPRPGPRSEAGTGNARP